MLLRDLVDTSGAVAATSSRRAKVGLIAELLRRAEPAEVPVVVSYLAGELRQRRTGVGYAAFRGLPDPAPAPSLGPAEVDAAFARIAGLSGPGSTAERARLLADLMGRATAAEQRFLAGLATGELRQGALDGIMIDAVTAAGELPAAQVRRAVMLAGAVAPVAAAALAEGADGLARFRLAVGQPLRPMLASPAVDIDDALDRIRPAGCEWKLDGVRVQLHRDRSGIRVFTRTLDDITDRLPEVVAAARGLPCESVVLDGEVLALDGASRPRPFQVTSSRVGTRSDPEQARRRVPLSVFFFDILHLDGADLVGSPAAERWRALAGVVPAPLVVPRLVTDDRARAGEFLAAAVSGGHEGVVVKSLDAPYDAGRRGAGWLKVKPRHTLDLVVLAAEWGHGRRTGRLSNLHLGARLAGARADPAGDPDAPPGFMMLGKTFKGLTDEMLSWQTERLLALEVAREGWVVRVRPELVVEVAFDGVQSSSRYAGGMALRFARVLRYRPDKAAGEADTAEAVRALHAAAAGGG